MSGSEAHFNFLHQHRQATSFQIKYQPRIQGVYLFEFRAFWRSIKKYLLIACVLPMVLLRFYIGLLTDFTVKIYNIGVPGRKVQKRNIKGDIDYEKDD